MNCPKCNSIIEQGESLCKMCGSNLNQTIPQNNQEIINSYENSNSQEIINVVQNSNNDETINLITESNSGESIKSNIIKYLKKCYIPFLIIFCIYMVSNGNIQQCYNETTDSTLPCTLMYLFNEGFFLITNFAIVLPFIGVSTNKLLKKFNSNETKLKIIDFVTIMLTSITAAFLTSKINVFSFFLVPIITLLYFSKDYISKKTSQKIYFLIIASMLITSFITGYVFYKIIIIFNAVIIPTISIIFYLLNHNKIKFKIHKLIPIVLVLVLLVFSSYQFLLKDNKSFTEEVKKENINLEYKDVSYLDDVVYVDDEKIYIISSNGGNYNDTQYLSKYNIENKEFEILFSNVKDAIFGDELLFFNKSNDIYMLNTTNDEVKKIIDKKYYGNTYHYMYYDNGNLYFNSNNTFYTYNINSSKITSFTIDENEEIEGIFKNTLITEDKHYSLNSAHYSYDFSGKKIKLTKLPSFFSPWAEESIIYQNYLYYFSPAYMDYAIVVNNLEKEQSFEYKIDLSDIYYDEMQQDIIERISYPRFLGVYDNKMYIQLLYKLEGNYHSGYDIEYENIYYFDISNFNENSNIKLIALNEPIQNDSGLLQSYLLDNFIYASDEDKGIMYKYNLDNNMVLSRFTEENCCYIKTSYDNYIYGSNLSDTIYRIDKNTLRTEKILGGN